MSFKRSLPDLGRSGTFQDLSAWKLVQGFLGFRVLRVWGLGTFCVRQTRHVRTLVLDLDDTLIHSDWTRGRGWKTFKRPGAEDFIRAMAQYYELVIPSHLSCAGAPAIR